MADTVWWEAESSPVSASQICSISSHDCGPRRSMVSKYRAASTVHQNTVDRLEKDPNLPTVFEQVIPEGNDVAAAAEFVRSQTLRQKYGYSGRFNDFRNLTDEFIKMVEDKA